MKPLLKSLVKRMIFVSLFGVAMAYMEAAVVVYLRRINTILEMVEFSVPLSPNIAWVEIGREFCTLLMILTVAWIAGTKLQSKIGYFIMIFGIWDIFYYLWLKILMNWPATLLDNDLLFLLPLPWWGPVIAPMLLALLMSLFGLGMVIGEVQGQRIKIHWPEGVAMVAGVLLCLYTFMADGLAGSSSSPLSLENHLPGPFQWTSYLSGLCLLIFAVWRIVRKQT